MVKTHVQLLCRDGLYFRVLSYLKIQPRFTAHGLRLSVLDIDSRASDIVCFFQSLKGSKPASGLPSLFEFYFRVWYKSPDQTGVKAPLIIFK